MGLFLSEWTYFLRSTGKLVSLSKILTSYFVPLHLSKRWIYYRCFKRIFYENMQASTNDVVKQLGTTGDNCFTVVLSLLSSLVNWLSYNKQMFHAFLFNIRNCSPKVINICILYYRGWIISTLNKKGHGVFFLLYATNTRQDL